MLAAVECAVEIARDKSIGPKAIGRGTSMPGRGSTAASSPDRSISEGGRSSQRAVKLARVGRRRIKALVKAAPGLELAALLASGDDGIIGIDLKRNDLIRIRPQPGTTQLTTQASIQPFDILVAQRSRVVEPEDPAMPEAFTATIDAEPAGRLSGGVARSLLSDLSVACAHDVLGFPGWSLPYWQLDGMRPSIALVVPKDGPVLCRRDKGSTWVRFRGDGGELMLPAAGSDLIAALESSDGDTLGGKPLAQALGFRPHFMLIALSSPRDGHCYKTVAALLPKP